MLVGALVDQIVNTASDRAHDLAVPSAATWLRNSRRGLLLGARHAGHAGQQTKLLQ